MANGFFLSGMADGMETSRRTGLAERTQEQDVGLRSRGLDIQARGAAVQERAQTLTERQSLIAEADKNIADLMGLASETIKTGTTMGSDPAAVMSVVTPLVEQAKSLAVRVGRDPAAFDAKVKALFTAPTAAAAATVSGEAKGIEAGTQQTSAARVLGATGGDAAGFIIDPAKRGEAEGKLRDDYLKESKNFTVIRDARNRMGSIDFKENPGAGDLALVFDYLKILDPNSTVREGEFKTATQVAGLPGVIDSLRNKILGEGQLPAEARKQILSQAEKLYQSQAMQQEKLTTQFGNLAKRGGLNPLNVIIDLSPTGKTPGIPKVPDPPKGFNIVR